MHDKWQRLCTGRELLDNRLDRPVLDGGDKRAAVGGRLFDRTLLFVLIRGGKWDRSLLLFWGGLGPTAGPCVGDPLGAHFPLSDFQCSIGLPKSWFTLTPCSLYVPASLR